MATKKVQTTNEKRDPLSRLRDLEEWRMKIERRSTVAIAVLAGFLLGAGFDGAYRLLALLGPL